MPAILNNIYFWLGILSLGGFLYLHFYYPQHLERKVARGAMTPETAERITGASWLKWIILVHGVVDLGMALIGIGSR